METWNSIHAFVSENEWVQGAIIFLAAEVAKRFWPSKSKESLTELIGKGLRFLLDKTRIPNKVKVIEPSGEKVVTDANPKNQDTKSA